jgi:hypothetical protein
MSYKNIEDRRKYDREYRKNNLERRREIEKNYNETHKEQKKEYHKKWYEKNKEKRLLQIKEWHENNPEKTKKAIKKWQQNNREQINIWWRKKYKSDIKFNLNHRIKSVIENSIKNNKAGRKWEDLVGYNVSILLKHLKSTIPEGYTWQDFLEGNLHIDHIIPVSVWNYTKAEHPDFKRCWSLENLRLLPAKENLSKGNKLDKPFQPSLALML